MPTVFNWQLTGEGTLDLTGTGGDFHVAAPAFRWGDFDTALPPGAYSLTVSQSLMSGQYGDTARANVLVLVVPEPATWALGAGAVVLLWLVRRRLKITAVPCVVAALALATPGPAQLVQEDVTRPLTTGPELTGTVTTAWESTRDDGTAFARASAVNYSEPTGGKFLLLTTRVRALGEGNTSEALAEAEFTATRPVTLYWSMIGPGQLDVTGPGIDEHRTNSVRYDSPHLTLAPGDYDIRLFQSIASGDWPGSVMTDELTASIQATIFVIPEPVTWALGAGAVVLLWLGRRRAAALRQPAGRVERS